jgi:predicted aldo/keto reductase-like oxidoreductase
MWYRPYGRTGKEISVVSFGGMRFENSEDIDVNAELLLHARDKGINFFDTAPNYCGDHSEDITGAAIKQMKRDEFYVSTKGMPSDGKELRKSLEKSLKRLNVEYVDFFHIWYIVSMAVWKERIRGGAVDAAVKAKEEGLIKHVVISSHLPGSDLREVLKQAPFEGVTLGYCAINFPYREEAVKAAGEMGIGVVTMNPLGGGIIPQNAQRLSFLKGPDDPSVVAAALRFNVSNPAVTSALVGITKKEHIDEAVAAVENFQPYDEKHIEQMRKNIVRGFDGLCTGCGYCLPCPEDIDIPRMMDAYNMKVLGGGKSQQIVNRLKWHWSMDPRDAEACSECGECEEKCTQHIPIRDRMKEIAQLADAKENE